MYKQKRKKRSKLWLTVLVLLVAVIVVFILEATNTTHFFHKSAVVRAPTAPISHISSKSGSHTTNKVSTADNGVVQGADTDKNGQVPSGVPTNPSAWSTSASGVITLKLPGSNATIQSGSTITGTASVSQVNYALIDNQVGVISQGIINVVNGNFTASISFKSYASSGRLDVFNTDPNGKEINEVQIPVNF